MTDPKSLLLMLKGAISELPAEWLAEVEQARDEVRGIVSSGEIATLGLALVMAELNAESA